MMVKSSFTPSATVNNLKRAPLVVLIFVVLLASSSAVGAMKASLVDTLEQSMQPGDEVLTDPNNWISDEDFRCIKDSHVDVLEIDQLCNNHTDCDSGEDELEVVCLTLDSCPAYKVKCPLERKCINKNQLCDGVSDCTSDAWDEREVAGCPTGGLNSGKLECPNDFIPCAANGKCINTNDLCNYNWDCDDGSDEDVARCPNGRKCPNGLFHCYKTSDRERNFFDHCITTLEVCNQIGDCPNYEDELPDFSECAPEELMASSEYSSRYRTHHHHHHHSQNASIRLSTHPSISHQQNQSTLSPENDSIKREYPGNTGGNIVPITLGITVSCIFVIEHLIIFLI